MDQRRILIAALLSLAILIGWQYLFPPPKPPAPAASTEQQAPAPAPAPPRQGAPTGAASAAGASVPTVPEEAAPSEPMPGPVAAEHEEKPVVETERFRAEFTNRGAQLLSFRLKDFENSAGQPVDLVRARVEGPYPFALSQADGQPSPLNQALFAVERGRSEDGEPTLTFRYSGPEGAAEKHFSFPGGDLFHVEVDTHGLAGWGLVVGPGLRNPTARELKNRFERRAAVYRQGQDVESVDPHKAHEPTVVTGAGLRWVGLEDTYFLAVLIPTEAPQKAVLRPLLVKPQGPEEGAAVRFLPVPAGGELSDAQKDLKRDFEVAIYPDGGRLDALAYWGAKQYDRLAALPYGLEQTVQWGMFGFLARPLLWGLQWIYEHVIHNYGWAIILMTLAIKIVLFPLTMKSQVSMLKMQQVNPRIQAIRQKYRGKLRDKKGKLNYDAQKKMNDEIMAIYKAEGINPAGGCLPMLLQIPVLFAFYRLLSTAIELRHAPWALWIHDLSAPDPYYVLPIVMGATQFLQQKLTPTATDPTQRKIFALMPIFFTVLFLGFPSGLVLYWLTNNLLTIVQQWIYNQWKQRRAEAAA